MKLRSTPLPISAEDPFRLDCLERRPIVESLTALVSNVTPPLVLCIDSPWGTGKTTFLRLWEAHLKTKRIHAIYFNAWTTDFASDPLVPFVSEIVEFAKAKLPDKKSRHVDRAKRIASLLAKRALPAAGKLATAGLLDLEEFNEEVLAELASESIKDLTDAYVAEKGLIARFHEEIGKLVSLLPAESGSPRLLLLVDELDRCRPNYALALLERIKHLFDVDNIVFALALDKRQLRSSVESIYGATIDSEDYLRRFLDLEYRLPDVKPDPFAMQLYRQFEIEGWFKARKSREFQYDAQNFHSIFCGLVKVFGLTLRVQEQCIARIKLAMLATPADHYFYPILIASLVVLRVVRPEAYKRFIGPGGSAAEILKEIRDAQDGPAFLDQHIGTVLECYLLSVSRGGMLDPAYEELEKIVKDSSAGGVERARAEKITEIRRYMQSHDRNPDLKYVLSKIELGFQMTQTGIE
jgi:hypothetical protein